MKILFIHNRYLQSAGGEDATVNAEASLLESKGHTVKTLLFENTLKPGFTGRVATGLETIYNKSSAVKVKAEIQQFAPDIIHVHNFFFVASPAVIMEAYKQGIPTVVTLQNYRLICANALLLRNNSVCELCVHQVFPWDGIKYKCYHKSAAESAMVGLMSGVHKMIGTWRKKVDTYITPANFIKLRLEDSSLQLKEGQIKVKRNFINDPGVGNVADRDNFYLFVGRLSAEKGVDVLLHCFQELQNVNVVIAGDGPDQTALLREFGHLKNVQFVGKKTKEEVIALMKLCKALIFPSVWYEGLPITIIEALATGTPVIASRLGAMTEMLEDGHNGILFEAGNTENLREAIIRFGQLSIEAKFLFCQAARQSYLDQYHPDICYKEIMDIYTRIIAQKKPNKPEAYE